MRKGDDVILKATVDVMKEKLIENQHKPPLTSLTLSDAMTLMKNELKELLFELNQPDWDYSKIRRELGDVINFAGAGVVDCDRMMAIKELIDG